MPKSKKFRELLKSTEKQYAGKKVLKPYQKKYGKVYSKKEAKSVAYAIGKSKKFKV